MIKFSILLHADTDKKVFELKLAYCKICDNKGLLNFHQTFLLQTVAFWQVDRSVKVNFITLSIDIK